MVGATVASIMMTMNCDGVVVVYVWVHVMDRRMDAVVARSLANVRRSTAWCKISLLVAVCVLLAYYQRHAQDIFFNVPRESINPTFIC